MPTFTYTAKDHQGNRLSGTIDNAISVNDVRDELQKMGYSLLNARKKAKRRGMSKRVTQGEIVEFTFKFAGMYSAGLGVMHCLEVLEEQAENLAFKDILTDVRDKLTSGTSLKKAFEPYEDIFSGYFLGMIEAGESSGELSNVLDITAQYLENRMQIHQKVKHAFTYPIVVVSVCAVVVSALIMFVVPMFSKIYTRMRVPLPGPTQFLVGVSSLVHEWWWLIIAVTVVAVFAGRRWLKAPDNRMRIDKMKFRLPIFGQLNRLIVVSRFNRTFATLISVGVPVAEALDVAKQVAANQHMAEIADIVQEKVQAGTAVARAMEAHDIFPPIIIHMADSGEQAGRLPDMLIKGSEFVDKDIDRIISSLLVKLEPILTVGIGSLIGVILLAVYLPMIDYMNHLK
ncbi:MAG: type II secretion system F family protein [Planctomycetes bacterium]|nr:type II secretion system F family protein [Planctomycetota bacterium]